MNQGLHGIDDHSGDGDVEPDGKGIASQPLMGRKAAGERKKESNEDERERNGGENNVRGEELPVKRPPRAEAIKVSLAVQGEVHQIGAKEDGREEERRKHGGT